MAGCQLSEEQIQKAVDFHGHWCPGLAIGLRAGEYVLGRLGASEDEELVAVVETDMCAVDAIQSLTGCTFGKGNLIYRDLGKMAFTFYRRADDQGVRLLFNTDMLMGKGPEFMDLTRKWITGQATPEEKETIMAMREQRSQRIMDAPLEEVFTIKAPLQRQPHKARLLDTIKCDRCGEGTMESRTRRLEGRNLCISCFEELEQR